MQTMDGTAALLSSDAVTPKEMMHVIGSLQWFDLLERSKLAVYRDVYDFERLPKPDLGRKLPLQVRSELQVSCALGP